jgi:peptidoglycan/LPS O-acetylase OafA/YrhL
VSVHAQFIALAVVGFALTAPALVAAWIMRLPDRRLATTLYLVGFALICATLIVDPILQPPLFYHGFFPGVGIGAIALALALVELARRRARAT